MNTSPSPTSLPNTLDASGRTGAPGDRALVLHGGGAAGNAWEIGVIAGLFEGGLDVTSAELIVGTSAGATAAVQITSASAPDRYAEILVATPPQRPGSVDYDRGRVPAGPPIDHMERTARIIADAADAADMRRRMGAAAIQLDEASDGSGTPRWRATAASRLSNHDWPNQRVLLTAVDARTGEGITFDRDSGVDLLDAVAASTSSAVAYRIGDDRYIDGGYRRNENADLAAGYERVLVLSPFGGRTRHPLEWGMQLSAQVEELRAGGSRVETILPDADALAAFGDNMMNLASRVPAARAGHAHGESLAKQLSKFWR